MKIVVIGPPGSGKGTLSKSLVKKFNFVHISTGDMIRAHITRATPLDLEVKEILEKGDLVSDELIMELVEATLHDTSHIPNGYILDGFPRTLPQAEWFVSHFEVDYYIILDISSKTVIERISGRRIHPSSGRIYHIKYTPPKVEERDDETGEALIQREDDLPDKVKNRLEVYKSLTTPIISFIESNSDKCIHINAEQTEQAVVQNILSIIGKTL